MSLRRSSYNEFTEVELMTCAAARLFEDAKTYFIGFGMPQLAGLLAQRLYTPNMTMAYEYGVLAPRIKVPFHDLIMGHSNDNYKAVAWLSMNGIFTHAALGFFDYGILGAVEIDRFGNINSTIIGEDYDKPKGRFPGSGGANEIASLCWKTIMVLVHEKRRFKEKLNFITSPGYLDGSPGAREKSGLPCETGPHRVVSSKAIFGYDEATREMKLLSVLPGSSTDEVLAEMEFTPLLSEKIEQLDPPSQEELHILREEIDPNNLVINKGRIIRI